MELTRESSVEKLLTHPGMQRVPTDRLELLRCRNFVSAEMCAELIELVDQQRRPSTIADDNGDNYFRTSETCDLEAELPVVTELNRMLTELSGINPAHGEPVQGQRYALNQEFKPHTDYFAPSGQDFEKFCSAAGQRTWTFMIYLNNVQAGGGTRFKSINKIFKPETGALLCWNNRRADDSVNPHTLHHGMKVRKGTKYVITKWYREKTWG